MCVEKKISVIIPVYNVEKYIKRCLDSVINQTYNNLEIILVDDDTPDNSGFICDEYAEKDERIKVIHKENGGVSTARNAGLDIATGEYITFVDPDDYLALDIYEKVILEFSENETDIVNFSFAVIDDEGEKEKVVYNEKKIVGFDDLLFSMLTVNSSMSICNKVYKKSVILDEKLLKDIKIAEDMYFNACCYRKAKSMIVCEDIGYFYYQRQESVMHEKSDKAMLDELTIYNKVRNEKIDKRCKKEIEYLISNMCITLFLNFGVKNAHKEIRHEIENYIRKNAWKFILYKSKRNKALKLKRMYIKKIYAFLIWLNPEGMLRIYRKIKGIK